VPELIAQRWIEGGDDCMYSLYSCLDAQSRPLVELVAHKLRQWPVETGCGSLAEQCDDPEVLEEGLALLRSARFAGLSSVQFKREASSGRLYLIEVNAGRPALNMPVAEQAGVPMLYTFYCSASGLALPEARVVRPGAKWICWRTDLAASWFLMRRGRLTPREWLRSVRGSRWAAILSWRDPLPFALDLARKLPDLGRGAARAVRRLLRA
jgi:predicted ATP-grasp superfamily ATP-dependent carboligase